LSLCNKNKISYWVEYFKVLALQGGIGNLKVVMILAGLIGGFFIELQAMRLTEAAVARALRSAGMDKRFFIQIAVKNLIILLVLTAMAAWSATLLLSSCAGMVLCIFFYVLKKNRQIGKTNY